MAPVVPAGTAQSEPVAQDNAANAQAEKANESIDKTQKELDSKVNAIEGELNKAIDDHMDKFISEEQSKDHYHDRSYDINDFDFSFVFGLSLEDGAATLTEYTAFIISEFINGTPADLRRVIVCGGGRKNKFLLKRISKKLKYSLQPIDNFGIDGDFVESQAFAYLAIRSYLKLPISFPETTGVKKSCTGGVIVKN